MSTDIMLRCALGVGDRTLSDFRSDGLSAREMERLRAHVAECPACQARLDAFEAMAQALRAQPEPNDHAQLWRNVRASIAAETMSASSRQRHHVRASRHSHSTRFWAAFGSVAAVVALSVGFIALFVSRGGWPPAATKLHATPTVNPPGSLTWRRVVTPQGFPEIHQSGNDTLNTWFAHAQSDGKIGYSCQANKKYVASPVVWATRDAGAAWSVITPGNLPADTGGCRIVVDANNANSLIVSFYPVDNLGQVAPSDKWVTYASVDGGETWTKPAGLQNGNVTVMQAFAGGKTYALRGLGENPSFNPSFRLYVSGDGMRTWRQIDATLPSTNRTRGGIDGNDRIQFWVNGTTSKVILETASNQLWSTTDDGAHWTEVTFPNATSVDNVVTFVAGGSNTRTYPTVCGIFNNPTQLYCTSDDGKTWNELASPVADYSGADLNLLGIGPDGSVYIFNSFNSANRSNQTMAIYRLPPGATKGSDWQRLGAVPKNTPDGAFCESVCSAFPSGQEMVFWLHPSTATTDNGTIVQPYYYVATYP